MSSIIDRFIRSTYSIFRNRNSINKRLFEDTIIMAYFSTGELSISSSTHNKPYLLIDVEGQHPDILELTILVYYQHKIIDIFHSYSIPLNPIKVQREAPYCHCLSVSQLKNNTKDSPQILLQKGRAFALKYCPAIALSNDISIKSDIAAIVSNWNIELTYKNIYLGDWVQRATHKSHIQARLAKFQQQSICGFQCNVRRLHSIPHKTSSTNATSVIKKQHGAHCSLYDAYELFLYLEDETAHKVSSPSST